ncbi:MAG TPA: OmpA family protein [Spirochaetales bacterium]|nr:OmpA family protein [Spirochaetales bacterium]
MKANHAAYARSRLATLVLAVAVLASVGASADEFRHVFVKGDKFRVLSRVDEDVYLDRRYSHSAEILNRIAFSVEDVRADGSGLLAGTFDTSVRYEGGASYVREQSYESHYWQSPEGRFDIADTYWMPVVRHVPTFPARDLKPGDTWTAPGEERHDLRDGFGIAEPYVIPIDVRYRYVGPVTRDGRQLMLIEASYTVFYRPEPPRGSANFYPVQIAGYSDQLLYWDPERGGLAEYEEDFKFVFDLSNGRSVEYRGAASAKVIEAELMDRATLAQRVEEAVDGLDGVSVQSDELGVTISLEDIQFEADSARLLPSERQKIERIAELLAGIPGRDILVAGHTALAGTAEGRLQLSVERAKTVAELLIALGARTPEEVTVAGYGADRPVASNTTEAGRSRNRRVEITILEN